MNFLKHDDSLFLWRDNHDLNVLSNLLNTKIPVVVVNTTIVTAAFEIKLLQVLMIQTIKK